MLLTSKWWSFIFKGPGRFAWEPLKSAWIELPYFNISHNPHLKDHLLGFGFKQKENPFYF